MIDVKLYHRLLYTGAGKRVARGSNEKLLRQVKEPARPTARNHGLLVAAATLAVLAKNPAISLQEAGRNRDRAATTMSVGNGKPNQSETPSPPAAPPPPTDVLKPPKLIRETRAFIPTDVLRRASGVVQLRLTIRKNGTVRKVDVVSGPEEIATRLASAAKNWLYESPRAEGHPVEITTTVIFQVIPPPI